ncbi:MAG: hypothetical protein LBB50_04485, partial [Oscillospiraceae bacterium]|nr:hypothetical protein [Oscillospiraceae bacterium]
MPQGKSSEYMPPEITIEPDALPDEQREEPRDERNNRDCRTQPEVGSITLEGRKGLVHCLTVIGQIEGHTELSSETKTTKYEH